MLVTAVNPQDGCMTLIDDLRTRGGFARTSELRELGHGTRAIGAAVEAGLLLRPRRGWVAHPGLDPQLMFALRHGVVLTCVTQARRLGVWVTEDPPRPHVAARSRQQHVDADATVHWARPMVRRHPGALVDPLPNVLGHVAQCVPFEHALATWESALNKGRTDLPSLAALPLGATARRVLQQCTPFSDSGLETLFKTRLRWLRVPIRPQVWLFGHRVDFLIGDRLVVQIDGKQHGGEQKVSDLRHDLELELRGYRVIRVSYSQVMHDWPSVHEAILTALAGGLHRAA